MGFEKDYSYLIALIISLIGGSFVIVQKYLLNHGIQWKAMITVNSLFFFVFGIVFSYYYRHEIVPEVKRFNWKIISVLGLSILLATFVGSILNYKLLERNDAFIVSGLTLAAPIFTLLFAKLFLKEDVSCKGVLGVLVMLAGSWLIIQAKREADAKQH
jgi:drug/metabolite transporter (DMT)-like permease